MKVDVKFVDTGESDQHELDTEAIRESIFVAVQAAIEFLDEAGFEYEEDLSIAYICGQSALQANLILRANYRIESHQGIRETIEVTRTLLSMYHHLEISDVAVDEYCNYVMENYDANAAQLRDAAPYEFDDEVDIFIYEGADIDNLHALIVHELWHLIEAQLGLFKTSEGIHEGTATYVQKRFLGMSPTESLHQENPAANALYDMVSKIVDEELEAAKGSLKTLLEKDFRKKLAKRVRAEVLPTYFEASSREHSKLQAAMIIGNPHYAPFIQAPSHENLIAAFKSMGMVKWADELDVQDTASYVDHLKNVLAAQKDEGHKDS